MYVLILFNDENDLSHCAVDTAMVRAIRTNLVSWGNASFNGKSANRTSQVGSRFFGCKVRFASVASISSTAVSNPYNSAKEMSIGTDRKSLDVGLHA